LLFRCGYAGRRISCLATGGTLCFPVSEHAAQVFRKIREVAELGIPAFAIIAIFAYVDLMCSLGDRTA